MDPATVAVIASLGGALRDGGPWVAVALLVWAYLRQADKLEEANVGRRADAQKCAEDYAKLLERCAGVLERAAGTMAAITASLDSREGIFERLPDLVDEIRGLIRDMRQSAVVADERLRERVDANTGRLEAILRGLEEVRARLRP